MAEWQGVTSFTVISLLFVLTYMNVLCPISSNNKIVFNALSSWKRVVQRHPATDCIHLCCCVVIIRGSPSLGSVLCDLNDREDIMLREVKLWSILETTTNHCAARHLVYNTSTYLYVLYSRCKHLVYNTSTYLYVLYSRCKHLVYNTSIYLYVLYSRCKHLVYNTSTYLYVLYSRCKHLVYNTSTYLYVLYSRCKHLVYNTSTYLYVLYSRCKHLVYNTSTYLYVLYSRCKRCCLRLTTTI